MSIQTCFKNPNAAFWQEIHWDPSPKQVEQLITLQAMLCKLNKKVNLTRLLDGDDYWISQVFDSLWPLKNELTTAEKPRNCIDVGAGCGFPGLAVAIALPGVQMTLVDSAKKKTAALKELAAVLGLSSRITVRTERIETTGHNPECRGVFDLAMARAVANAPVVAEYLIPLIKPQGEALLFRGQWGQIQQKQLTNALIELKGKVNTVQRKELPAKRGIRHLIRITAKSPCPTNYPRSIGIPSRKPLGTKT